MVKIASQLGSRTSPINTRAGTVTTSWNSERTGDSGAVVFRGAMWNRTLAPGDDRERFVHTRAPSICHEGAHEFWR